MTNSNAHEEQKSKVSITCIPAEGYAKALVLDIRTAIKLTKAISLLDYASVAIPPEEWKFISELTDLKKFVEEVVSALEK